MGISVDIPWNAAYPAAGGTGFREWISARPLQYAKAHSPMEVTVLGMVMDVRPLQFVKAPSPIEVTELGIVMDVRQVAPKKVFDLIAVTLSGMTRSVTRALSIKRF